MEQFRFENLSDDDQLELLKYMPIKDRVRFERVNTNLAHLLNRLWLSQKQLKFGKGSPSLCHPFRYNEVYHQLPYMPAKAMLKIINRCNNLKALEVESEMFEQVTFATKLANLLNDNCKELEHLRIPYGNRVFFELFKSSNKFTCLLPLRYKRLKLIYNKKSPTGPLPLKLIDFQWDKFCPLIWNLINKETVEHLDSIFWNDHYSELTNLKSCDLAIKQSYQTNHFHQLEHISLDVTTEPELRQIFENHRKLVSLRITYGTADELMDTIVELGYNLTKLDLAFDQVSKLSDYQLWQNFANLTKLRKLEIFARNANREVANPRINVNGLILLLETCTKLKHFGLNCASKSAENITTKEKEQIRKVVAAKSYRQWFATYFSYERQYLEIKVFL